MDVSIFMTQNQKGNSLVHNQCFWYWLLEKPHTDAETFNVFVIHFYIYQLCWDENIWRRCLQDTWLRWVCKHTSKEDAHSIVGLHLFFGEIYGYRKDISSSPANNDWSWTYQRLLQTWQQNEIYFMLLAKFFLIYYDWTFFGVYFVGQYKTRNTRPLLLFSSS